MRCALNTIRLQFGVTVLADSKHCNTVRVDDDGVTCAEAGGQMEMNSLPVTRFGSLAAETYLPLPWKNNPYVSVCSQRTGR